MSCVETLNGTSTVMQRTAMKINSLALIPSVSQQLQARLASWRRRTQEILGEFDNHNLTYFKPVLSEWGTCTPPFHSKLQHKGPMQSQKKKMLGSCELESMDLSQSQR
jgi:hypothetical protein